MAKKSVKFPTLAVILLVIALLWLIDDMTIVDIHLFGIQISWLPLILTVISIAMIFERYHKG